VLLAVYPRRIVNSLPFSQSQFFAPAWARGAHLQTVWAPLARNLSAPPRVNERLELRDGDFVDLYWTHATPAAPLVIVLHGLAGSVDSVYVAGIQAALQAHGISSVAMNFRGAGGAPNRLARTYHAGDTGDLAAVAAEMAARFPQRQLGVLGYSLGGNVTLKWLGETGIHAPVIAACAVSTPFDLAVCAARLDQGFSRIYRNRLRDELVNNLIAKEAVLRANGAEEESARLRALGNLRSIRTFREFDNRVIAPLHGFRDADDYYRRSSARQFMRAINVPTLVIHAQDDPFMTASVIPATREVSSCVQLAVSPHGGHVGFVQGTPWQPRYWLEERIPAFFAAQFLREK